MGRRGEANFRGTDGGCRALEEGKMGLVMNVRRTDVAVARRKDNDLHNC